MADRVISLRKDRVISLTKDGTKNTEKLRFISTGLRWGRIPIYSPISKLKKLVSNIFPIFEDTNGEEIIDYKEVDLDSSIVMYGENGRYIETVYYRNLRSSDGSIVHRGDDRIGSASTKDNGSDLDNETINIDLDKVSRSVKYLVVILNSYSHDKFDDLPYASMKIYDNKSTRSVLAEYIIDNNKEFIGKEALVLGVFYRFNNSWNFKAIGTSTEEKSITEMIHGSALSAVLSLNI